MKIIAGIILVVALLLPGEVVVADTFTLDNYAVTTNASDPGLIVNSAPILGQPFSWNLDVGQSVTFDLFEIWTPEAAVNADDRVSKPITVSFDWTAPAAIGVDSTGTTVGQVALLNFLQWGKLSWDAPVTYSFGNGGEFQIALTDAVFNEGSFWGLGSHPATVEATLTYTTASVPEPSLLLLLGAGLVGIGSAAWRKVK